MTSDEHMGDPSTPFVAPLLTALRVTQWPGHPERSPPSFGGRSLRQRRMRLGAEG